MRIVVDQILIRMQAVFPASLGQWVVRMPVELHLGIHGVILRDVEFVIDSGTDITQVPESVVASALRPALLGPLRRYRTAAGEAQGHEFNFTFSFASLPEWTFPCIGLVNRHIARGLLAWRNVVRRFDIRTIQRTSIPDLRNRMLAGRPGALSFVLYPAADQDGVRPHA